MHSGKWWFPIAGTAVIFMLDQEPQRSQMCLRSLLTRAQSAKQRRLIILQPRRGLIRYYGYYEACYAVLLRH